MIARVGRVLRLSLTVGFVSGLGFAATNANAQFVSSQVCADPEDIEDNFGDPLNWEAFGGVSNCNKICKSYANKCKAFSKSWHACAKKATSDEAELDRKAFCDPLENKDDKKTCKTEVNEEEQEDKASLKSNKDEFLSSCESIESDCVSVCVNGLPE